MKHTCLLTLSGGIDSTVLAHHLVSQGEVPLCIYIDYETKCKKGELLAAEHTCKRLGLDFMVVPFPLYKDIAKSYILGNTPDFEKGGQFWLNGRNGLIGFILAIMAVDLKVDRIYMGSNADDFDGYYLDTTTEFYAALNLLIKHSIRQEVIVRAPLLEQHLKKSQVISLGEFYKINWVWETHSCSSSEKTCCEYDKCESCFWRKAEFEEAGFTDPFKGV